MQEDIYILPVRFVDHIEEIMLLTSSKEIGKDSENTSRKEEDFMGKPNMPTRIETGDTTVQDKWTVVRIMLYFLLGALLIGIGIGMFL